MPAPNTDGVVEQQGTVVESLVLEEADLGSLALDVPSELEHLVNIDDELEPFNEMGDGVLVDHEVTVVAEETVESILPEIQDEESSGLQDHESVLAEDNLTEEALPGDVLTEEVLTSMPDDNFSIADEPMRMAEEEAELGGHKSEEDEEEVQEEEEEVEEEEEEEEIPQKLTVVAASSGATLSSVPVLTGSPLVSGGNIRLKSYSGPSSKSVAITGLRQIRPINSLDNKTITVNSGSGPNKQMILSKVVLSNSQSGSGLIQVGSTESGGTPQTIRLINAGNKKIISSPTKSITVAQARQLGFFSGKLPHILPNSASGTKLVVSPKNTVTVMKQPTRILPGPAPAPGSNTGTSQIQALLTPPTNTSHKILIRQGGTVKTGTIVSTNAQGQVIRIPAPQSLSGSNIHQLQIPGKTLQYVRLVNSSSSPAAAAVSVSVASVTAPSVVTAPAKSQTVSSVTKPIPVALIGQHSTFKMNTQRVLIPAPTGMTQLKQEANASASASAAVVQANSLNNIVVVPQFLQQQTPVVAAATIARPKSPVAAQAATTSKADKPVPPAEPLIFPGHKRPSQPVLLEPNGIRPRKPCNCTKSQCLKLYCDCFANGEFCHQCNCNCCFNNLEHEEDRQRAIKSCLERNPNAFRPKIGKSYVGDGERRHNKGCNCKRSGCLKNYCECYEAKISCSNNCKCVGCQNVEDAKNVRDLTALATDERNFQQSLVKNKLSAEIQGLASKPEQNQGARKPFTMLTQEVIEATCQCLLTSSRDPIPTEEGERLILEEFGRCLIEIINCANLSQNQGQSTT
ncbi:protein lin-54 homolog isoform X4 [Nilaparvata lugens]|uniref:protein lin-54 homolog isoform X3 n=1 Tax=Nilaparvata lugens TaxID=108931 RepID=UPI00193D853D|nr:protein lin-54 homolog isoform X3 [Nilaparvata lugens]XP_039291219.1 protein lin-54 homolog isoform X4 [Nilaparvata lugens]